MQRCAVWTSTWRCGLCKWCPLVLVNGSEVAHGCRESNLKKNIKLLVGLPKISTLCSMNYLFCFYLLPFLFFSFFALLKQFYQFASKKFFVFFVFLHFTVLLMANVHCGFKVFEPKHKRIGGCDDINDTWRVNPCGEFIHQNAVFHLNR